MWVCTPRKFFLSFVLISVIPIINRTSVNAATLNLTTGFVDSDSECEMETRLQLLFATNTLFIIFLWIISYYDLINYFVIVPDGLVLVKYNLI